MNTPDPLPVMPELLPCPFCGNLADHERGATHYWVACQDVDCGAETRAELTCEAAIAAWNTRAAHPSPSHDALVEAAYREGFGAARESLTEDEGYCLTADVEHDAWMDSEARAALAQGDRP